VAAPAPESARIVGLRRPRRVRKLMPADRLAAAEDGGVSTAPNLTPRRR
jgi:hypothetical protein